MKKLLFCLLLMFSMTMAAFACPCTGDDKPCQCPPGCQCSINAGERVNDLPEDGKKWYIMVFSDNPEHNTWFQSDTHLVHLRKQVHYTWVGSNSPMYKERYAKSTPKLPCIRLQDSTGKVVYNVAADKVPATSRLLSYSLHDSIREYRQASRNCPDGNCRPRPSPGPVDPPVDPLTPDEIPTITPDEPAVPLSEDGMPPLWALALAAGVGVLGAGAKHFADTMGA